MPVVFFIFLLLFDCFVTFPSRTSSSATGPSWRASVCRDKETDMGREYGVNAWVFLIYLFVCLFVCNFPFRRSSV